MAPPPLTPPYQQAGTLAVQVSENRIRRLPPPLRVTRPPPSNTTLWRVLITLAVRVITMVTGLGPQLNVTIPPAAMSRTTADDVQLAGFPFPTTWLGRRISTARPAGGAETCPPGLPKCGAARVAPYP